MCEGRAVEMGAQFNKESFSMNLYPAYGLPGDLIECGASEPTPSPLQGGERENMLLGISSVSPRTPASPGSKPEGSSFGTGGFPMKLR